MNLDISLAEGINLELVQITAGSFRMGSADMRWDEEPQHELYLPEYWIGRFPVTVVQYAAFIKVTGYAKRPGQFVLSPVTANYPVVQVTWQDAQAFCCWVQSDLLPEIDPSHQWQARLPGEAEWEKTARGTDGREYPWGAALPDDKYCNYFHNLGEITPVGQYSPLGDSPYGCADMAGNVWEWTHSLYQPYPYDPADGREAEEDDGDRVVRGGSMVAFSGFMRCAVRAHNDPTKAFSSRGFRLCVSSLIL